MPEIAFLDLPPEPERLREVFVWVGIHADGREGMMSADLRTAIGIRHMPLMSSRRGLAEQFMPLAMKIRRKSLHGNNRIIRVEMRRFLAE